MRLRRRVRLDARLADQKENRLVNGPRKRKERARRDARMVELVKNANGKYSPAVASWIASQLGKPAAKASAEVIQALTA